MDDESVGNALHGYQAGVDATQLKHEAWSLGYILEWTVGMEVGDPRVLREGYVTRPTESYSVLRIGASDYETGHFESIDAVREYLSEVSNYPWWRLDLDDATVRIETTDRGLEVVSVDDDADRFPLRGWSLMEGGSRGIKYGDIVYTHIAVRSQAAPASAGQWYRWDGTSRF